MQKCFPQEKTNVELRWQTDWELCVVNMRGGSSFISGCYAEKQNKPREQSGEISVEDYKGYSLLLPESSCEFLNGGL